MATVKTRSARLNGEKPPREFRIFKFGWNRTSKGEFLFDEKAAKSVMSAFKLAGIDGMIDLEHLSIDPDAKHYDPDSRGAYQLEVRDGDLWAVDVKWTPEGAERLTEKRQRYVSPFFTYSTESRRIEELYNIAICAIPATYEAPALIAASKRAGKNIATLSIEVGTMDLEKLLAALGLGKDASLEEALAAIKALQGEEETAEDKPEEEMAEDKPAEKGDEAELAKLPSKLQARVMASLTGYEALKEQIATLNAKQRSSEVEELISKNSDKIPLKLEPWARKQSPDTLREFLSHATIVARPKKEEPGREGDTGEVKITDADRAVAKLSGVSLDKILEQRKREAANRAS